MRNREDAEPRKRIKVLFCNHQSYKDFVGGAELFLLNAASCIDKGQYHPYFLSNSEGRVNELAIKARIPVQIIEYDVFWEFLAPGRKIEKSLESFVEHQRKKTLQIEDFIKESKIDIVISNCIVNIIPLIAAKKTGIPTVWLINEIVYAFDYMVSGAKKLVRSFRFQQSSEKKYRLGLLRDYILEFSNVAVFPSNKARAKVFTPGHHQERAIVMNPPIKHEIFDALLPKEVSFPHVPSEAFLVAYFGLLLKHKGVHDFITAASKVSNKKKNIHFAIAGGDAEPKYYIKLKRMVKRLKLEEKIIFPGFLSDPLQLYDRSDVVCMTSLYDEPFGMVVTEAMVRGKTVLAYDTGSIREIVQDGINGFIIPKGNTNVLADKIITLANDRTSQKKIGENARESALRNYSPHSYVQRLEEIVQDAVERK